MKLFGIAVLAATLLAGCTTMTVEERANFCRSTDWQRYGLNDGKLGIALAARSETFEDCAEVGQPVNLAAYEIGRDQGLLEYCTAENGFRVGYEGRRYAKVCPPEVEPDFLQGYKKGSRERPALAVYPRIGIGIGSGCLLYTSPSPRDPE